MSPRGRRIGTRAAIGGALLPCPAPAIAALPQQGAAGVALNRHDQHRLAHGLGIGDAALPQQAAHFRRVEVYRQRCAVARGRDQLAVDLEARDHRRDGLLGRCRQGCALHREAAQQGLQRGALAGRDGELSRLGRRRGLGVDRNVGDGEHRFRPRRAEGEEQQQCEGERNARRNTSRCTH